MNLLITICARGGSKGIPGKNIRLVNGVPLIAYSINHAQQFAQKYNADIALSTNDQQIKNVSAKYGLTSTYDRIEEISTDSTGKIETINHLLNYEEQIRNKKYDYILDLDVTSPLRNLNDLESAFYLLQNDPNAQNLFSVNMANRNPYFNMVEQKENGYYSQVKTGIFLTRQSAPLVYDLNASFYFYRRIFFTNENPSTITSQSLIYQMPHICFDLDHSIDMDFMEYLLSNNKLGFSL